MKTNLNAAFCQTLLKDVTNTVRAHFPDVVTRSAWVHHFRADHYEFHGPDQFYWHGSACGAYHARYKGWSA